MKYIKQIKEFIPLGEQEKKDKEATLKYIEDFEDILTRDNELVHMTASAFIVNKERTKALMVHHNIFNSWSFAGGHADGKEDLLEIALSEVREETGITNPIPVSENIISIDILPVLGHFKNNRYISAHLHISVSYLFEADENEKLYIKADENSDVRWLPIDEINNYSNEVHMKKVYAKIISKIKKEVL